MGRWFERHLVSLVFGFIGAAFVLVGGGFLWGYLYAQQEIETAEQIPLYTAVQLGRVPSDTLVAVEGRISERNTSHVEGLVVYTLHQYQGVHCDDDDCEEVWAEIERVTPALWLDLSDGRLRVGNTDYELFNPPEVWQTTPNLIEYSTLEYQGFRMGNPVYVIGELNINDELSLLNANFLYGGNRQDYLLAQSEQAVLFLWMGGIFAGLGLIFLAVAVVTAVRM